MAGLTAEGLIIQRLNDILITQRQKAVDLFKNSTPNGEDVDTSENTTLGRLIALAAPANADLWEAIAEVDSAFDPDKATGIALDKIVKYGGITRDEASKSTVQCLLVADTGIIIPFNSALRGEGTNAVWRLRVPALMTLVAASGIVVTVTTVTNSALYTITYTTSSGIKSIEYTADASATATEIKNGLLADVTLVDHPDITAYIDDGGNLHIDKTDPNLFSTFTVDAKLSAIKSKKVAQFQAEEDGETVQSINTIKTIITPVLGWDSATNFEEAKGGRLREEDEDLRVRFRNTKFERANNILEAIYSALINVDDVLQVVIYENDTSASSVVINSETIPVPAHSFMAVVLGGADIDIANTIWQNKPLGIRAFSEANIYQTIFDSQGFPHLIGINRPTNLPIFISLTLDTNGAFPGDGALQVKQAIVDYFKENFGIGDDIIYSRIYTPINSVLGHQVNSFTIGTTASPVGTSNVVVAYDEIYTLDPANIVITIV